MRPSLPRDSKLAKRIQAAIDLAGGFERAARLSGISRRSLGDWVRDKTSVPVARLAQFAEGLGVDFAWLQSGEGEAPRRLGVVTFPSLPPPLASELAPAFDLHTADVEVEPIGAATLTMLDAQWASALGLSGGVVSVVSADESAAPRIHVGEPVLGAHAGDAKHAVSLHPQAVWILEQDSRIIFRTIFIAEDVAVLTTIGAVKTTTKIPVDRLVLRGRAVWSGAKL